MSLTRELANRTSPVSRFLVDRFPNHRAVIQDTKGRLAESMTVSPLSGIGYPYMTVGMALDYRIRFYYAASPLRDLDVAQRGLNTLAYAAPDELPLSQVPEDEDGFILRLELQPELDRIVTETRPVGWRLDRPDEERLCRYCYALALFDATFRNGVVSAPLLLPKPPTSADDLLAIANAAVVEDLCALSWAFFDRCGDLLSATAVLNPVFTGSGDVGGADADIIVDGCLAEIKATIKPTLTRVMLDQLLGYVLLDYGDDYRIREVAVYMARQGVFLRWPLDALMGTMANGPVADLARLRDDFRAVAARKSSLVGDRRNSVTSDTEWFVQAENL